MTMFHEDVEELYKLRVENKQMAQKLKTVLQENTNIKRVTKEKEDTLTLKVQKLTTKLAEKTALVHEFANFKDNQLEAESIPVLKILGSLKALDDQIAAYHSDILVLKARVADLVQKCNDCKEEYEAKEKGFLKALQTAKEYELSYKLLNQQQLHLIDVMRNDLSLKIADAKNKKGAQFFDSIASVAPPTPESDIASVHEDLDAPGCVRSRSHNCCFSLKAGAKRPTSAIRSSSKAKKFKLNQSIIQNGSFCSLSSTNELNKSDMKNYETINDEIDFSDPEVGYLSHSSSSEDEESTAPYEKFRVVNQPLKPAENQSPHNIKASVPSSRSNLPIKDLLKAVHLTPKSVTVGVNGSLSSLNIKSSRLNSSFASKEDAPILQEKIVSKNKTFKRNGKKRESSIFSPKLSNEFQEGAKKQKVAKSVSEIRKSSPEMKEVRMCGSKTVNNSDAEEMNLSHSCSSNVENLIPSQNLNEVNQAAKASNNQSLKSISAVVSISQGIIPPKGLEVLALPSIPESDTGSVRRSLRSHKEDVKIRMSQEKKVRGETTIFRVDENKKDSSFLPPLSNKFHKSKNKLKKLSQAVNSEPKVKTSPPEMKEVRKCGSVKIDGFSEPKAGSNLSDSFSSDEDELKDSQQNFRAVNQTVNAQENQPLKNIKALVSSCKSLLPIKEILSSGVKEVTDTKAQRKLFETISPCKALTPNAQTDSQTNPTATTDLESTLANLQTKAPESQFMPIAPHNSLQTFQGTPSVKTSAPPKEEISNKGFSSSEKSFKAQSKEISLEQNEKSDKHYNKELLPLEPNKCIENKRKMLDSKLHSKHQHVIGSLDLSTKEDFGYSSRTLDEIFKYCSQICQPVSPLVADVNEDEDKIGPELIHSSHLNNKSCEESAINYVENEVSLLSKSKTAITGDSTNVDIGSNKVSVKLHANNVESSLLDLKGQKDVSFDKNSSSDKQNCNVNGGEQDENCIAQNVNNLTDLKENTLSETQHPVDSSFIKQEALLNTASGERITNALSQHHMRQISVPKYFCKNQIVPRPSRSERKKLEAIKTEHEKSKLFKPLMLTKQKAHDLLKSDEIFKYCNQVCHPLSPLPVFIRNEEDKKSCGLYQNSHLKSESCEEGTKQCLDKNKIIFQMDSEAAIISNLNSEDICSSFDSIQLKTEPDEIIERSTQSNYKQENVKSHLECNILDLSGQKSVTFEKSISSEEQKLNVNELDKSCKPLTESNSNEKKLSKPQQPLLSSPNIPDGSLSTASSQRSPDSLSRYNMRRISVPKYYDKIHTVPRSPKFELNVVKDIIIKHEDSRLLKPIDSIKQETNDLLDSDLPSSESEFVPKTSKSERKLVEETETNHGDIESSQRMSLLAHVLPTHQAEKLVCKTELEDVMPSLAPNAPDFSNTIRKPAQDLMNHCNLKETCSYYACHNQPNPENVSEKLPVIKVSNTVKINSIKVPLNTHISSDNIGTENADVKIDLPLEFTSVDSTKTSYKEFSSLTLNEYLKLFDKRYGKELYVFASGLYYASRRRLHEKSFVFRKAFKKMKNSKTKILNTSGSCKKDDKEDIMALISQSAEIVDMSGNPDNKLDHFWHDEKPFTKYVHRKSFTDSASEGQVSQESKSNASLLAVTKQITEDFESDLEDSTSAKITTDDKLDSLYVESDFVPVRKNQTMRKPCHNKNPFTEHALRKMYTDSITESKVSQKIKLKSSPLAVPKQITEVVKPDVEDRTPVKIATDDKQANRHVGNDLVPIRENQPMRTTSRNKNPSTEHVLRKTCTDSIYKIHVSHESKSNSSPLAVTKQITEVVKSDFEDRTPAKITMDGKQDNLHVKNDFVPVRKNQPMRKTCHNKKPFEHLLRKTCTDSISKSNVNQETQSKSLPLTVTKQITEVVKSDFEDCTPAKITMDGKQDNLHVKNDFVPVRENQPMRKPSRNKTPSPEHVLRKTCTVSNYKIHISQESKSNSLPLARTKQITEVVKSDVEDRPPAKITTDDKQDNLHVVNDVVSIRENQTIGRTRRNQKPSLEHVLRKTCTDSISEIQVSKEIKSNSSPLAVTKPITEIVKSDFEHHIPAKITMDGKQDNLHVNNDFVPVRKNQPMRKTCHNKKPFEHLLRKTCTDSISKSNVNQEIQSKSLPLTVTKQITEVVKSDVEDRPPAKITTDDKQDNLHVVNDVVSIRENQTIGRTRRNQKPSLEHVLRKTCTDSISEIQVSKEIKSNSSPLAVTKPITEIVKSDFEHHTPAKITMDGKQDNLHVNNDFVLVRKNQPMRKTCHNKKPFEHLLRKTCTDSISKSNVNQEIQSKSLPLTVTKQMTEVVKSDSEVCTPAKITTDEKQDNLHVANDFVPVRENQPMPKTSSTTNSLSSSQIINLEERKCVDDDDDILLIDISDDEEDNILSKTNPYCSTLRNSAPGTTSCMSLPTSANLERTETKPDLSYCTYILPAFNSSSASTRLSIHNSKPFSSDCVSALPEVDVKSPNKEIDVNKKCAFIPQFYTESETKTNVSCNTKKEEILNNDNIFTFPVNRIFKKNSLDEFVPQGEKIKLAGNVLKTAINHHTNNLDSYTSRNIAEKRKTLPKTLDVGEDLDNVMKILEPFVCDSDLTPENLNKLAKFSSRKILMGLVSALLKVAEKATVSLKMNESRLEYVNAREKSKWILNLSVSRPRRNVNHKGPPELHQKIKEAISLLLAIKRYKSNCTEPEPDYVDNILSFIEEVIFGIFRIDGIEVHSRVQSYLVYVYTALARLSGQIMRVRTFVYDVIYCYNVKFAVLVLPVLETWEDVLPVKHIEEYYGDPIALTVIFALTTAPLTRNITEHNRPVEQRSSGVLRTHMNWRYRFGATTVDAEQLFNTLISRPCQQDVLEALVLLMKRRGESWSKQRPLKQMLEILQSWRKGEHDDTTAAAIIKILGCTLRSFNGAASQFELQPLFELLKEIVLDEKVAASIKEVVAITLCCLSRVDFDSAVRILAQWKPEEVSSEVIDRILIDFMAKRSFSWWKNRDNQLLFSA